MEGSRRGVSTLSLSGRMVLIFIFGTLFKYIRTGTRPVRTVYPPVVKVVRRVLCRRFPKGNVLPFTFFFTTVEGTVLLGTR